MEFYDWLLYYDAYHEQMKTKFDKDNYINIGEVYLHKNEHEELISLGLSEEEIEQAMIDVMENDKGGGIMIDLKYE